MTNLRVYHHNIKPFDVEKNQNPLLHISVYENDRHVCNFLVRKTVRGGFVVNVQRANGTLFEDRSSCGTCLIGGPLPSEAGATACVGCPGKKKEGF